MEKAEITALLSLIFILLVSFAGSVMESTSIQVAKNYRRCDMNRAMECVFAEYQKELLTEYDVFGLDAGYESGDYEEDLLISRLEFYGAVNSENIIERIEFLSDNKGRSFYEQVIYYMEHKYGLNHVNEHLEMTDTWEKQEQESQETLKEDEDNKEYLQNLLEENEAKLPDENNPISYIEELKKVSLLQLIMPADKTVSEKQIVSGDMVSHRSLNQGYGDFSDKAKTLSKTDKLLFGEYVMEHFHSVMDESEGVLDYEVEYIIAGKANDRENLNTVVNKLLLLRFVANYAYLQTSAEKKAEAQALAATLCSVLAVPAITQAAAEGILLAWAFGEAIVDMRTLMNGNKVPLVKDSNSWQLSLSGLMKLAESQNLNDGRNDENGLSYEEYLRMLLYLEEKENVAMRSLDILELNLNKIKGLSFFRADLCVTKLEITSRCSFRRSITYTFPTYFGYQ